MINKNVIGNELERLGVPRDLIEKAERDKQSYQYRLPNHGIKIQSTICTSLYHLNKEYLPCIIQAIENQYSKNKIPFLSMSTVKSEEYDIDFARIFPWQSCFVEEIYPISKVNGRIKIAVKEPFSALEYQEKRQEINRRINLFRVCLKDNNINKNMFIEYLYPQVIIWEYIKRNLEFSELIFSMLRELIETKGKLRTGGLLLSDMKEYYDDKSKEIADLLQRESMAMGATKMSITLIELLTEKSKSDNDFKMIMDGIAKIIDLLRPPLVPMLLFKKDIERKIPKDNSEGMFLIRKKVNEYCNELKNKLYDQQERIMNQIKTVVKGGKNCYIIYGYSWLILSAFETIKRDMKAIGKTFGSVVIIKNKNPEVNVLYRHLIEEVASRNEWEVLDFDQAVNKIVRMEDFQFFESEALKKSVPITRVGFVCVGACSLYHYGAFCELNTKILEKHIRELSMKDRKKNPRPDLIIIAGDYKFLYDFIVANRPLNRLLMKYHDFLPLRRMDAMFLG